MADYTGIDFTNRKKDRLEVRIGAGDDVLELGVLPPTVRVHNGMSRCAEQLGRLERGEDCDMTLDEMLAVVAACLSNNAQARAVTPEWLEGIGFDVTDVGAMVGAYLAFMDALVKAKN